jgi:hypothetical protein
LVRFRLTTFESHCRDFDGVEEKKTGKKRAKPEGKKK